MVNNLSDKKVDNMKKNESPYLEKPDSFDPAIKNKDDLVNGGGGGGKDGEK